MRKKVEQKDLAHSIEDVFKLLGVTVRKLWDLCEAADIDPVRFRNPEVDGSRKYYYTKQQFSKLILLLLLTLRVKNFLNLNMSSHECV